MMIVKKMAGVCLIGLIAVSCNQQKKAAQTAVSDLQGTSIFPKGEKITNNNFVGNAWLHQAAQPDSVNQIAVGSVTFEPGARTNWHLHPAGQILIGTEGVGYYQEKGGPKRILRKGDVVKCPPNIPHWHGASRDQKFIQVAITSTHKGATVWLMPVTDAVYNNKMNP